MPDMSYITLTAESYCLSVNRARFTPKNIDVTLVVRCKAARVIHHRALVGRVKRVLIHTHTSTLPLFYSLLATTDKWCR